jgi:hypothetical protein
MIRLFSVRVRDAAGPPETLERCDQPAAGLLVFLLVCLRPADHRTG